MNGTVTKLTRMTEASPVMVEYCFDTLAEKLTLPTKRKSKHSFSNDSYPLFVTWYKNNGSSFNLRGCIGTFSPTPLHEGLREYALTSAFRDSRFKPMIAHEFKHLKCSINLLVQFESVSDAFDWEIGTHGIRIKFTDPDNKSNKFGATYLPSVCSEQGWTKTECLESLIDKSGYKTKNHKKIIDLLYLERYQSSTCDMTHDEYQEL
jgi:uncharacterized protein (TIGR00296 family)